MILGIVVLPLQKLDDATKSLGLVYGPVKSTLRVGDRGKRRPIAGAAKADWVVLFPVCYLKVVRKNVNDLLWTTHTLRSA